LCLEKSEMFEFLMRDHFIQNTLDKTSSTTFAVILMFRTVIKIWLISHLCDIITHILMIGVGAMIIKPTTALRNEYTEISRIAKESGEPIYLTKNGEGDLVVMAISAFEKQKKLLELKAKILEAEEQRLNGLPTYTQAEVRQRFAAHMVEENV